MSEQNDWNKKIIDEFRANDGVVGGFFEGSQLLLLHTKGARTGLARINPLITMPHDSNYVVIASKAGAPSHPDWYYNLVANQDVEVEVGTERYAAKAIVCEEPQRTELYNQMAERFTLFKEYAEKAGRTIPVIVLERTT